MFFTGVCVPLHEGCPLPGLAEVGACAIEGTYRVSLFSVLVYGRSPGGRCWDDDPPSCADLPDVEVRLLIGDAELRTGVCDSASPDEPHVLATWPAATLDAVVEELTVPQVWIYDVDGDTEELMGEYSIESLGHLQWLTIETLRQGGVTIYVSSSNPDVPHEVRLVFQPL